MKRRNATRKALVASVVSLLLCVSMLVGTTFAWFTDEVTTGMNTIAAGNLDIELYAGENAVNGETKLFDDVALWEPGVVAYENLQVKNVGTLALKYQMSLNFGNENDLNGHKLSEVLKVAVIDKIADNATREEVLAAAQAAVAKDQGAGALSNFYLTGALAPKGKTETINNVEYTDKSDEMTVVVFWAPNDNEIDNLYNANNGQKTSDGEPLHINFGVNLQATQLMYEDDSFGNDYDKFATILPKATVNSLPGETLNVVWGIGGSDGTLEAPFKMQFQPNESYEEAAAGQYGKYHADFVVKADRNVPAGTMALAGFYNEWCKLIDGKWVALRNDDMAIAAGEQIRLVEGMGNGSITVNYEEICNYGNDGTGFLCTAADLTGANAGTTITVELRLYETYPEGQCPESHGGHLSANCETGNYNVVGTYTYTFPKAPVASNEELSAALTSGDKDIDVAAGTYTFPGASLGKDVTLHCEEGTVFEGNSELNINGATVVGATFSNPSGTAADQTINGTFKDCTFTGSNALRWCYAGDTVVFENCVFSGDVYGVHFDGGATEVIFKDCTISGFNATAATIAKITFDGCTFVGNGKSSYNGINLWGNGDFKDCTFVFDGTSTYEWIDLCSADKTATFTNCVVDNGSTTENVSTILGTLLTKRETSGKIIIDGVEASY